MTDSQDFVFMGIIIQVSIATKNGPSTIGNTSKKIQPF